MHPAFSILTTCKPGADIGEFLANNEVISCCEANNWPCTVLNAHQELPDEITRSQRIVVSPPSSGNLRPVLNDFLSAASSEWLIITNSDVWIRGEIELLLEFLDRVGICFASARRWDLPEELRVSEFSSQDECPFLELKRISKRQSMRTLDVFLIKKNIFKAAVQANQDIGLLAPGTVGFDNNFFGLLAEFTRIGDLSSVIDIFHTNHEPFRRVLGRNHLLCPKDLESFSQKRNSQRALVTSKGCLTFSDFIISQRDGAISVNRNRFRRARYYKESARVRLINWFDKLIFNVNFKAYNVLKKNAVFGPSVAMLFGVVIVFPVIWSKTLSVKSESYADRLQGLIGEQVKAWKSEHSATADRV